MAVLNKGVEMKDHISRKMEQQDICPYCSNKIDHNQWESEFVSDEYYLTLKCDCGKKLMMKMDHIYFNSSNWDKRFNITEDFLTAPANLPKEKGDGKKAGNKVHTLEGKVKIIKEYPDYKLQEKRKNG